MNVVDVERLLRDRGCALTPQRSAILHFLDGNLEHPTAAQIFEAVTADFPVTSRATVYNTLALLEEVGAVRTFAGKNGETRFDPNVAPHHHLHCPTCGRLEDVPAAEVTVLRNGLPARGEVQFEGACAGCAATG